MISTGVEINIFKKLNDSKYEIQFKNIVNSMLMPTFVDLSCKY